MFTMPQFTKEFKKKIAVLHLEGRSIKSLSEEYSISKASVSNWVRDYREECLTNPESKEEYDSAKELARLKKELEEVKKENLFLKKAAAFFAKEIN